MKIGRPFRRFARFLRDDVSGAGAVEFAIVAPVLLILFLGGSELGVALTMDRKVKAAAGAAVDLASQSMKIEDADFRKLMGIARGTLAPYSIAPLQIRLTQIAINKLGAGTVDWSCATTGYTKLAKGSPVQVPPEYARAAKATIEQMEARLGPGADPTIYLVRGESRYAFTPITGEVLSGPITLSGTTFVLPRYSDKIESQSGGCSTFAL